jgi:hypothetical protein
MPIQEQGSFVELNRRFRKIERKAKAEEAAVESYTASISWPMDSLSWDDLLKENRAVVLGEPGSGKSREMRERSRLLNGQGALAFFVRLDRLAALALACELKITRLDYHAALISNHQKIVEQKDAADYIQKVEGQIVSRRKGPPEM